MSLQLKDDYSTDWGYAVNFEGYVERVEFHFDRLGVAERPTQREYVDAWNNQMPAKKMAQTFARRLSRKTTQSSAGHQDEDQ
jgi:hypothetical protein